MLRAAVLAVLILFTSPIYAEDEVSLREYLEMRLQEQDKRVEQARLSAEEAKKVLVISTEKRLDLLNEFRNQAADESRKYATREMLEAIADRVLELESSRNQLYGGLLIVGVIGVANLVKLFWGK